MSFLDESPEERESTVRTYLDKVKVVKSGPDYASILEVIRKVRSLQAEGHTSVIGKGIAETLVAQGKPLGNAGPGGMAKKVVSILKAKAPDGLGLAPHVDRRLGFNLPDGGIDEAYLRKAGFDLDALGAAEKAPRIRQDAHREIAPAPKPVKTRAKKSQSRVRSSLNPG